MIIDQFATQLKKGDKVVILPGLALVQGQIIDIDESKNLVLIAIPVPFIPNSPFQGVAKIYTQKEATS